MKNVLKWIGIVVAGLFVLVTLFGFLLPGTFKVERSATIAAPPAAVYPLISRWKDGWLEWSPFDREDPDILWQFSGPAEGVGAARSWKSKKTGDGEMTLTAADPAKGVEYELRMVGFNMRLHGRIGMQPEGAGTRVTWTDEGDFGKNPYWRYFGVMMDKMMGKTFEKGLAAMKEKAEAAAKAAPPAAPMPAGTPTAVGR